MTPATWILMFSLLACIGFMYAGFILMDKVKDLQEEVSDLSRRYHRVKARNETLLNEVAESAKSQNEWMLSCQRYERELIALQIKHNCATTEKTDLE